MLKQMQINQPKGVKTKNERAQIKKWHKLVGGIKAKGIKQGLGVLT
jgi:hypothetical protein